MNRYIQKQKPKWSKYDCCCLHHLTFFFFEKRSPWRKHIKLDTTKTAGASNLRACKFLKLLHPCWFPHPIIYSQKVFSFITEYFEFSACSAPPLPRWLIHLYLLSIPPLFIHYHSQLQVFFF